MSAVPSTATSTPAEALDGLSGKAPSGVVLPPRDIRAILEKTAGYCARNGSAFEDRIRAKESNNPRFSFLNSHDAYHPYYAWRLEEIKAGRGTAISAGRAGEEVNKKVEKPVGPDPPADFHFSARMPNISALDLEVVRLTALFVAKNGRPFATALSQRESTQSQFDFLRPQHSLYQFFSRLVDQYSELLTAAQLDNGRLEKARIAELERNVSNKFLVLEKAKKRAEWVEYREAQKAKNEEEVEAERLAYAQIDWHDFVVVETVVFNEADDQTDLSAPVSLSDLQSASLEQKASMSLAPSNMRIEEAMPTDDDYNAEAHILSKFLPNHLPNTHVPAAASHLPAMHPQPHPNYQPIPPPPPPPSSFQPVTVPPHTVKIRENNIVPRAMARLKTAKLVRCPQCGEEVLMDDLQQHMKIELLDPQWREQRAKAESRHATTNLSTFEVAENLKRLASQRDDVFDPITGRPLNDDEQQRLKKTVFVASDATARPHAISEQPKNIDEQIRSIQERFRQ